MATQSYKKEKKVHNDLLDLLKRHFLDDEKEMMEEEDMEEMKPMKKYVGLKRGRKSKDDSDTEYEGKEMPYDEEGEDDSYYDELTEEGEDDEDLSKDKRKNLAILIVTKRAGKGDRKAM